MSSDKPTNGTTNLRILWLVVGHVVVGLLGALVSYLAGRSQTLRGAIFLGLVFSQTSLLGIWGSLGGSQWWKRLIGVVIVGIVFSQTSLLGIWGGLGTNPWWSRLIGVVVGVGSLGLLLAVGVGERASEENYFIVSVATALIIGVLLVVRCFRVRICVATVDQAAAHRMQFTIRQLLVLTFAVACLVSLGKWLAPHLMNVTELLLLTLIGLVFATVGVLSVWPALGARHPVLPSLIVIVVAAGVGFGFAQFLPPMSGMARFWTTVTSVEALSLVPSLLVVRSCGYRLVRLPSRRQGER